MRLPIILAVTLLAVPFLASAHEPVYIATSTAIHIPDADTSRAYYGELSGIPAVFDVTLTTPTNFYLNILSPDITGSRSDFSAIMKDGSGRTVIELSGGTWETWYEEFGGDNYLKGPEQRTELPAGAYTISVQNPGNTGKFVLAPGEREVFTLAGTPETIRQIYLMKTKFFNKTPFAVFQGVIGMSMLGLLVVILILVSGTVYFVRRRHVR